MFYHSFFYRIWSSPWLVSYFLTRPNSLSILILPPFSFTVVAETLKSIFFQNSSWIQQRSSLLMLRGKIVRLLFPFTIVLSIFLYFSFESNFLSFWVFIFAMIPQRLEFSELLCPTLLPEKYLPVPKFRGQRFRLNEKCKLALRDQHIR